MLIFKNLIHNNFYIILVTVLWSKDIIYKKINKPLCTIWMLFTIGQVLKKY